MLDEHYKVADLMISCIVGSPTKRLLMFSYHLKASKLSDLRTVFLYLGSW